MSSQTISPTSLARLWLGGWGHVSLLVTNLLTGMVALTLSLLTLAAVLSIPGGGIGLILLIPAVRGRAVRALASRVRVSTPPRGAPYGNDEAGTIDGTYTEVRRDPSLPPSGWSRH